MSHITMIDCSAVLHAVIGGHFKNSEFQKSEKGYYVTDDQMRKHLIGSLLYYKNIKGRPSDTIIALDNGPYWRKDILPFYKGLRKSGRDKSDKDWSKIYDSFYKIMDEVKENFPWKVIDIPSLEADDVIGILAPKLACNSKVLIVSADKDLVQLQRYGNIDQYSTKTKKLVKPTDDPITDMYAKVIRGDAKDGVANVFSDDEFYLRKSKGDATRQSPVATTLLTEAKKCGWDPKLFLEKDEHIANFKRNQMLIDLSMVPNELKTICWSDYINYENKSSPSRLQNYLIKNKMKLVFQSFNEI